ncbi:ABC transporter permease [Roseibium sp. RKSG952]|uniref:ABC transporter permease n=1 Tax=Roseibium sp. RKSG952 TaxID=2529384 RepID=UPI0012BD58B5|nr:ABC transporter permease [Roseibium sp. RKSG952]MTH95568.1 ABC transporter permease [Roseibium sp. RKSG952]
MTHALVLVAQRIALGCLLLLAVSAVIFAGTEILPGDVAQSILGRGATPESLSNLRQELGLNEPAVVRYFHWLGGVLQGDLGNALSSGASISEAIGYRLANTLFLAAFAAVLSIPLAVLLGLVAVRYKDRFPDKLISASTLASISLPEFFIGYLLILVFGVKLGWLPTVSIVNENMNFAERLTAIILPGVTLTLVVLAHMMRMTRAAILNVIEAAYIETAELKGLGRFKIIYKHALPNALSPIVNVVMLNMAYLIVGVVVVEVIFVYPGMGQYLVDHVAKRDVPVVQACGLVFAAIYILLNLLADVISILTNPRLLYPK